MLHATVRLYGRWGLLGACLRSQYGYCSTRSTPTAAVIPNGYDCTPKAILGSIPLQANGAPTRGRLPALRYPSAPSQRAQRGFGGRLAVEAAAAAAGH
jgi:hypothetical protein